MPGLTRALVAIGKIIFQALNALLNSSNLPVIDLLANSLKI